MAVTICPARHTRSNGTDTFDCDSRKHLPQQWSRNHLVRAQQQRLRQGQAQRCSRPQPMI
jgi:hypothetical protein